MTAGEVRLFTDLVARGGEPANDVFRRIVEALPVAVYTTDAEGRLTYFNQAAVQLAGRVPKLGTEKWCVTWKIFLPDGTFLPHDQCPMAVSLKGGEVPTGIECIAERPDGSRFWFTPYPAVLRNEQEQIIGGINLLIDITDRKNAELEAQEQFRAIVETTPECVKIVAPDGTLLFMNSQGLTMVAAPNADAVVGKNVYDIIAPQDRQRFREFNERICQGEKESIEFDIIGLDGQRLHMETHAAPLRHVDGTTVHLAITHEITERKQAERAVQWLGAIVDSSEDAIISKNLDGIITSWNQSAHRLFGYTEAETIGKPVTLLIPTNRLQEEPQILDRLKRGERVDHFETVRRAKDGTLIDLSLTISPVRDKEGKIVGASKIARDIRERKKAEAEQKRIEDELRRANQDLEQFAFSASHDLQEPLRSVKIFSELLTNHYGDSLQGEAREYLEHLVRGATRMELLIRDLLNYTQVSNFEEPVVELANAEDALNLALTALAGTIKESGAQITTGPLPTVRVQSTHMQQLFQNLIGNAIKYRSPDRRSVIGITAQRQEGSWLFAISDNGIGIEAAYSDTIFGLFKRLHTNDEYTGTGIGLAICRRIVDRYHGRIWVESEPGTGSTFRFTLPV